MKIVNLTPYEYKVRRNYLSDGEALFVGDTSIAAFDAYLPDAQSIKDSKLFFQNDSSNILGIKAQFGQSINGVEIISVIFKYQSVLLVSDGNNYRVLIGTVPEIPATYPLGLYWKMEPTGYDLHIQKDVSLGAGTGWTDYDKMYMSN